METKTKEVPSKQGEIASVSQFAFGASIMQFAMFLVLAVLLTKQPETRVDDAFRLTTFVFLFARILTGFSLKEDVSFVFDMVIWNALFAGSTGYFVSHRYFVFMLNEKNTHDFIMTLLLVLSIPFLFLGIGLSKGARVEKKWMVFSVLFLANCIPWLGVMGLARFL